MHIVKSIWSQFFILWTLHNGTRHYKNEDGYKVYQHGILTAKAEALYLLQSKLPARDKRRMFNNQEEVNTFVATHSPGYVEQWFKMWQLCFRKGDDKTTTLGTTKTKLSTSYFKCKTSTIKVHHPRRHQTIYNAMDNDRPIDGIQGTM